MSIRQQDIHLVEQSELFDASWYRDRYLDVDMLGLEPAEHFLRIGARLLRDPGPGFDTAHYLASNPDVLRAGFNPLVHYLLHGRKEGRPWQPSPPISEVSSHVAVPVLHIERIAGVQLLDTRRKTVLLCAHQAGQRIFGAERSFLDVLEALIDIGHNVIVSTPGNCAEDYLHALIAGATEVVCFPYSWWERGRKLDEEAVGRFCRMIEDYAVDAVHANTVMLREPLAAARRCGIPAIVHARELVTHDETLCDLIGEAPDIVVEQVVQNADWIIANSEATASCFHKAGAICVVPNTVDQTLFALPPPAPEDSVKIALVSSNLPKKGLHDFIEIAQLLKSDLSNARFLLIGPDNEHSDCLRAVAPSNVEFSGYRKKPADAIMEADIVVNLSHFQESFGRTVLEAMAGARPVVAYEWGALPELVVDGETGWLVPYRDIAAAAAKLAWMCADPRRVTSLGCAGRARAKSLYGRSQFRDRLRRAYLDIWQPDKRFRSSRQSMP